MSMVRSGLFGRDTEAPTKEEIFPPFYRAERVARLLQIIFESFLNVKLSRKGYKVRETRIVKVEGRFGRRVD